MADFSLGPVDVPDMSFMALEDSESIIFCLASPSPLAPSKGVEKIRLSLWPTGREAFTGRSSLATGADPCAA